MSESSYRLKKVFPWQVLVLWILVGLLIPNIAMARQALLKKIEISQAPLSVKLFVTQNLPVKVIQIEKKELLIALKNVEIQKGFEIKGKENTTIKQVSIEKLPGNVIAVILSSHSPYTYIQSEFSPTDSSFVINLEKKKTKEIVNEKIESQPGLTEATEKEVTKKVVAEPVKGAVKAELSRERMVEEEKPAPAIQPSKQSDKIDASKSVKIPTLPSYIPPVRKSGKFKGDIGDLAWAMDELPCDSKQLTNSIVLLKKELYAEAFEILDQYIFHENFSCLEQAYFLRAFAFYKSIQANDFALLIKAERLFQDALVSYPESAYNPYGYAAIGMIQNKLNNVSAAEGYFNIIKQVYLEYSGFPEVMYHLAQIYDQKGYPDKALRYYKQVFEDTVENNYISDAGIGYGRALFNKKQYLDSLTVLNYVVASNPKKVYASHELLLHIGNANFEVGRSRDARQTLTRVLNLFPEMDGRDIILSKIGDTYGMENNHDKAIKVYELVREKFPDSDGFISSSIGIARYLKKDQEKIDIYVMIKTKFPENKFARIAMMRLAEIYQGKGEYSKCIKEIEDLLSTHPRGLRYEAVKLMQKAYEALFKKQLKSDEYTKVLNRYELEHTRIDRMGSRKIALSVGTAYLQAKLYEEAFNHLINAYKQYKRSSRSPELLLGLGVAMDESGRDEDALKLFEAFSKRFLKNRHRVEALTRSGQIYLEKNNYKLSSERFDEAYRVSKNNLEKGKILILNSDVFEKKGDLKSATKIREEAIKEIALAPGENYEVLTDAYKKLGGTYTALKMYTKSADAYLKALSFSVNDQGKANIGFLLGDAYQKSNIIPKAIAAFKQVAVSYDSLWARLAQQRLSTLELVETLQNS